MVSMVTKSGTESRRLQQKNAMARSLSNKPGLAASVPVLLLVLAGPELASLLLLLLLLLLPLLLLWCPLLLLPLVLACSCWRPYAVHTDREHKHANVSQA